MEEFFSSKYQAGYPGEDSQRSKAERMFRSETNGLNMNVPQSHSSKAQQKMRLYADGGHAAGGEAKRRGGRARHHAAGGPEHLFMGGSPFGDIKLPKFPTGMARPPAPNAAEGPKMARGGEAMRRGGHKHRMPNYQTNEHFPRLAKKPRLNVQRFQEVEHMADGGKATGGAMRRGGRSRHHAEGGVEQKANGGGIRHFGLGGVLAGALTGLPGQVAHMAGLKKGGKATRRRHFLTGGALPVIDALGSMVGLADGGRAEGGKMRRGGHKHCHAEGGKAARGESYARGGNVYEREMLGEHPSRHRPHFNYEAGMRGEHCTKRSYSAGGDVSGILDSLTGASARVTGRRADGGSMAMGGVGKIRHNQATRRGQPINRRVNKDRTHY